MPIVNFENFAKLPTGAIFSYFDMDVFDPELLTGLYVKGTTIIGDDGKPITYLQRPLIANDQGATSEVSFAVGESWCKWSDYDFGQLYYIYSKDDLESIQHCVEHALEII